MDRVPLLQLTGHQKVDEILQGTIGIFEKMFPTRIRAYYLIGSYATGNAVSTSDLDVVVVFKGKLLPDEEALAHHVEISCQLISSIELDLMFYTEEQILQRRVYGRGFALTRRLVFGEAFDEVIPLPPIEKYLWFMMNSAYEALVWIRGNPQTLTFPVDYPGPKGTFYGYAKPVRLLNGESCNGAKQLLHNVCVACSAIIGFMVAEQVTSGSESVRVYKKQIGDRWTGFLETIYEVCRIQWNYIIPEDEDGQRQFHDFCQQALGFERHFLKVYRDYLLKVLHSGDMSQKRDVVKRFGEIIFPDGKTVEALQTLESNADEELQDAINQTISKIHKVQGGHIRTATV